MKLKKITFGKLKAKSIENKKSKSKLRKIKKRYIIIGLIILALIGFKVKSVLLPKQTFVNNYTTLHKAELVNNINVTGTITSNKIINVYSKENSTVKTLNVKVGDKVEKGDVLAVLDSADLQKEIKQLEEEISASEKINSIDLKSKEREYQEKLYSYDNETNINIKTAESTLNSKNIELEQAQSDYEYNKQLFSYGEVSDQTLRKAENDYESAKKDYDQSTIELENVKRTEKNQLESSKEALEAAKITMNDNSKQINLENKKESLQNCEIKAPVSGTITSVNAVEGVQDSGVLFTIENLNDLCVEVPIKEVDILNIKVGQEAEVKLDAVENAKSIKGEVAEVIDIATKETTVNSSSNGSNNEKTSFSAKIKIKEKNENIKLGMNSRIKIITKKVENAYSVPFECIIDGEKGKMVYVAEPLKNGKYIVKEVPVETGMETDINVEIKGKELKDGIIILNDASYPVGTEIALTPDQRNINMDGGNAIEG